MGMWRLDRDKAQLHRFQHQIAYRRAADAGAGHRMPSEHFSVVGVDDEDGADDLSIPAGDLKDIGAPAQIRAHHHHLAVMQAALAAAGVLRSRSSACCFMIRKMRLWLAAGLPSAVSSVHQRGDAAIAIGRTLIDHPTDQWQQLLVGFA